MVALATADKETVMARMSTLHDPIFCASESIKAERPGFINSSIPTPISGCLL